MIFITRGFITDSNLDGNLDRSVITKQKEEVISYGNKIQVKGGLYHLNIKV